MISIYNSVESPIKDIEILGNTVDGVSVGILQDDGQYKITLFTNNGLDNMSPDYREDKEELLLPCQLEKIGDSTDRLYYDKEEKAWCIYKVGQSKIVLPVTFTISLNSFYGTTNLYMVSGEVEGTIKAKVSKSLGASVSSLNDKADVLIDKIDAMLGGRVDLDGYATIEYVDVKDGEIKDILDNMFEEYGEEQISIDFPNASTISIVDNDDLFTSTTIEGALRELANNSGSGNAEGIKFDNSSNEMTSVNVQDAIEENKTSILNIENELSKSENTSYTTENGIKEFECKNGYVDNVVIEGKTLVNLVTSNWTIVGSGSSLSGGKITLVQNGAIEECKQVVDMISSSKQYTLIYEVESSNIAENSFVVKGGENIYPFGANETLSTKIGINTVLLTPNKEDKTICFAISSSSSEGASIVFKNVMLLEGDHTDKPISYFEGLKSVGQGDKIEVLTRGAKENIFPSSPSWVDGQYVDGRKKIMPDVSNNASYSYCEQFIDISSYESLYLESGNKFYQFYDESKNPLGIADTNTVEVVMRYNYHNDQKYNNGDFIIKVPSNAKFIRVNSLSSTKDTIKLYGEYKYDKKQILTTLRSLPNGVKDTIEKRGNKYYKIKRCGEITFNGSEVGWDNTIPQYNSDTVIGFVIRDAINTRYLFSDKFGYKIQTSVSSPNFEYITCEPNGVSNWLVIGILKSKLSSQDVEGFKTWLKSNPVTVVYELETPIIEELPNFNPQTFSDKTTLLLNSGAVQGEASFEVTNSLGSELEVLKDKVSNLDDYVVEIEKINLLNGWSNIVNEAYVIKNKNVVTLSMSIGGGITTNATTIGVISDKFRPKSFKDGYSQFGCVSCDSGYVYSPATIVVWDNGKINADVITSNKRLVINASWYV